MRHRAAFGCMTIGVGVVGVLNARRYGVTVRCERSSIRNKWIAAPVDARDSRMEALRSRSGRRQHRRR